MEIVAIDGRWQCTPISDLGRPSLDLTFPI